MERFLFLKNFLRVLRIIANLFSDLKTLTNEQEIFSANYGRVPAAVKPLPFSYTSPAFLSVTGSPSPLQQGVDCNLAYQQVGFNIVVFMELLALRCSPWFYFCSF